MIRLHKSLCWPFSTGNSGSHPLPRPAFAIPGTPEGSARGSGSGPPPSRSGSASHNTSHNIPASFSRMSAKPLCYNAPGETRTPNLLIRSHFRTLRQGGSTAEIRTVGATQIPKADKNSRNNSHNIGSGR